MMPAASIPNDASVGACLDDLLASRFLPRQWARRIFSARELPSRLEQCAKNLAPDSEWRAYGDDRVFFAVARAHGGAPLNGAGMSLDVFFLDDNATVYSAGVWEYDRKSGWWLDDVLGASYDCERGWWRDGLVAQPSEPREPARLPGPVESRKVAVQAPRRLSVAKRRAHT